MHACKFGMEAIPNCANEREIPGKNEQANSSNDHTFAVDTFRAPVKQMAFVIVFWSTYIPFVSYWCCLSQADMRCVRSAACGSSDCSAATARQRFLRSDTGIRIRELPIALDKPLAS